MNIKEQEIVEKHIAEASTADYARLSDKELKDLLRIFADVSRAASKPVVTAITRELSKRRIREGHDPLEEAKIVPFKKLEQAWTRTNGDKDKQAKLIKKHDLKQIISTVRPGEIKLGVKNKLLGTTKAATAAGLDLDDELIFITNNPLKIIYPKKSTRRPEGEEIKEEVKVKKDLDTLRLEKIVSLTLKQDNMEVVENFVASSNIDLDSTTAEIKEAYIRYIDSQPEFEGIAEATDLEEAIKVKTHKGMYSIKKGEESLKSWVEKIVIMSDAVKQKQRKTVTQNIVKAIESGKIKNADLTQGLTALIGIDAPADMEAPDRVVKSELKKLKLLESLEEAIVYRDIVHALRLLTDKDGIKVAGELAKKDQAAKISSSDLKKAKAVFSKMNDKDTASIAKKKNDKYFPKFGVKALTEESVEIEEASNADLKKVLATAKKLGADVKGNTADFGQGAVTDFSIEKGKIKFDGGKSSGVEYFKNVKDAISALMIGVDEATNLEEASATVAMVLKALRLKGGKDADALIKKMRYLDLESKVTKAHADAAKKILKGQISKLVKESEDIEEGSFDKLEKKLGRINPDTLGDVLKGKIKLNSAEQKEFDAFMKGARKMFAPAEETDLEEAVKWWTVTITKKAGKLFKGQTVDVKANNSAEAIKKGIKQMKGDPVTVPSGSVDAVLGESVDLEEAKRMKYATVIKKLKDGEWDTSMDVKQRMHLTYTDNNTGRKKVVFVEANDLEEAVSQADIKKILAAAKKAGGNIKGNQIDFGMGAVIDVSIEKGKIKLDAGRSNGVEYFKTAKDAVMAFESVDFDLKEAFSRLPGNVINNELYVVNRAIQQFTSSQKNGDDVDEKKLNQLIKALQAIKKEVKQFKNPEDVPLKYQYKSK